MVRFGTNHLALGGINNELGRKAFKDIYVLKNSYMA